MSFHTKSIERILSPVAQQVLKLILLFEDAGSGTEIPDLEFRVNVVKLAVDNLIKVGHQTIEASDDQLLQKDMPPSLKRVEDASFYLQEAVVLLQKDPSSSEARKNLIEGSRGILQGTSSVLLTFDMSEVRKIIEHCRRVLVVLATAERVSSLTDLADFVKRLTPCMADMIKEVHNRQEELTIQSHSALLLRGIEQVKRLTPILISSLKLCVNTHNNNLPGAAESQANRDFLLSEMSSEIHEIIRGLQLTETDSSELFDDDLAAMHMNKVAFDSRLQFVNDWISDSNCSAAMTAGEKALNQVLNSAQKLANLDSTNPNCKLILNLCDELKDLAQSLIHLRRNGQGNSTEANRIANALSTKLSQLSRLCKEISLPHQQPSYNPLFRLARTLEGKLVQAQRWLADPRGPLRHIGLDACRSLVHGARNIILSSSSDYYHGCSNDSINTGKAVNNGSDSGVEDKDVNEACFEACEHVERAADRLFTMSSQAMTPETKNAQQDLALAISRSLAHIWQTLVKILTTQVAEAYTDLVGPLRQLVESASPSSGSLPDQNDYNEKMKEFLAQCNQLVSTAELAACTTLSDVWRADALRYLASQLNELGGQVVLAGRAVVLSSDPSVQLQLGGASLKQATSDHFLMMRQHWSDTAERMRVLVDEAIDANAFISAQEAGMLRDTARTEKCIAEVSTTGVVESTTRIARRANRVLQLITREADNSEDPLYVDRMNDAVKALRSTITPMVNDAKGLVTNIDNPCAHDQWRTSNRNLLTAVNSVKHNVSPSLNAPITYYHEHYQYANNNNNNNLSGGYRGIAYKDDVSNNNNINDDNNNSSNTGANNGNSYNNHTYNSNNNNDGISSSKSSSQVSTKELTTSTIPIREIQGMTITDVSHSPPPPPPPYTYDNNYSHNNNYNNNNYSASSSSYSAPQYLHKPMYEIKVPYPYSHQYSHQQSQQPSSVNHHHHDHRHHPQVYQPSSVITPHSYTAAAAAITTQSPPSYTHHSGHHQPQQNINNHTGSNHYQQTHQPGYYYHTPYNTTNNNYSNSSSGSNSNRNIKLMKQDYGCHVYPEPTSIASPTPDQRICTPETEVDEEFNFPPPGENQPIMAAAHALHHETRLWSSRDNELIAATKRMAALMAQLSQIVRGEYGTKKDLITVSMAIAEASIDVNQCAKVLARECTDRRIRSNLLHLSDRILTIGNQLKILSTVKATMLGTQDDSWFEAPLQSELDCGSKEDQENTESLVGNAQNLMQTVIETLHVAEGASIKMRVHSGHKFVWQPRGRVVVANSTATATNYHRSKQQPQQQTTRPIVH
uniref:Vinculin n=1 Tax=Trichobilharzia regenti TaxID=157069 RepID=A0AA85KAU9_TRIRE|nr:unnamed protein product [Trichobilharzia regenti]